jgi:hypothetical protein
VTVYKEQVKQPETGGGYYAAAPTGCGPLHIGFPSKTNPVSYPLPALTITLLTVSHIISGQLPLLIFLSLFLFLLAS